MFKTCKAAIDDDEKSIHQIREEIMPQIQKALQQQDKEITKCIGFHVSQIRKAGKALKKQFWAAGQLLIDEMSQQITSYKDRIKENKQIVAMENAGSVPEANYIVTHSDLPNKVKLLEQNTKRLSFTHIPSVQCELYNEEAYSGHGMKACTAERLGLIKQICPALYNRGM